MIQEHKQINGLDKFACQFKVKGSKGPWLRWDRFGTHIHDVAELAKKAICKEYGQEWQGSFCITNLTQGQGVSQ